MHGELPQELSVAAFEALGTGTGHAGGKIQMIYQVFKLYDVEVWSSQLSCWECELCTYIS